MTRAARIAAALCDVASFLIPFAVYIASVSHEPGSWDTAEFQGVPYILGICHPTGFPFFVLLGFVWSHVVAVDSVAFRMNAFSGLTIALAATTAYAVALELGAARLVALFATLWYAFTQDVWSHASRAEAQDLAVAFEAFAIYAFVRWMKGGAGGWFAAAFALYGLALAAHPNAVWLLPGFAVGTIVAKRRPPLRLVASSLALTALGLALYLYLPLRSAYILAHHLDPTVALGSNGGIFWNYHNPSTPGGLLLDLTGGEFDAPHYFLASMNPVHVQDALWAFLNGLHEQFGAFVLVLALAGVAQAWRRDWRITLFLCIACTTALAFSVTYPNESDVGRYRLLALWLTVPLLGALAPRDAAGWRALLLQTALIAFLAAGTAFAIAANTGAFYHPPNEGGRWIINGVRRYVPPGSIVLVTWLDATSLAYGAYVDGSLAQRIIVSGWDDAHLPQYLQWAKTRPVFILADPHDEAAIPTTRKVAKLDEYHVIFEVKE